jgi:hypothetical protein
LVGGLHGVLGLALGLVDFGLHRFLLDSMNKVVGVSRFIDRHRSHRFLSRLILHGIHDATQERRESGSGCQLAGNFCIFPFGWRVAMNGDGCKQQQADANCHGHSHHG